MAQRRRTQAIHQLQRMTAHSMPLHQYLGARVLHRAARQPKRPPSFAARQLRRPGAGRQRLQHPKADCLGHCWYEQRVQSHS
jgi:hypothetical protein